MDGLQSFKSLCDSIPQWHERLDALAKEAAERHAEFTRQARSLQPSGGSLRRRKTGSMESLRPDDINIENQSDGTPHETSGTVGNNSQPEPMRVDINPDSRRLFQDYRLQSKRKRVSQSIASNASGQRIFRSKHSGAVVYYDSAIQEHFSWLVRTIAGARNSLRKGKTAASFRARMAGMGMEESPFRGDHTSDISMRNPKIPRLAKSSGTRSLGSYDPLPYDEIDKELEAAQSLCEIGAHQFLRDGNCNDEVSGTKERFNAVLKLAKEQHALHESETVADSDSQRDLSHFGCPKDMNALLGSRSRLNAASAAVEKLLTDAGAGGVELDSSMPQSIAVDVDHLAIDPTMAIAVDDSFSRPMEDISDIAIDQVGKPPAGSKGSSNTAPIAPSPDAIAIDDGLINQSVMVDKSFTVDTIAVDSSHASESTSGNKSSMLDSVAVRRDLGLSAVAVDADFAPCVAVDPHFPTAATDSEKDLGPESIAVDQDFFSGSIAVDDAYKTSLPTFNKPMATGISVNGPYHHSAGPIEVDDEDDDGSFHIDLSAFRRTSRV